VKLVLPLAESAEVKKRRAWRPIASWPVSSQGLRSKASGTCGEGRRGRRGRRREAS
jgi:hypothetical protein